MTDRRSFLGGAAVWAATTAARAQRPVMLGPAIATAERIPVWPGPPPGADRVSVAEQWVRRAADGGPDDIAWPHVATPMLSIARPERANGTALLICPGGGYARVATGRNPGGIAREFAARGVTVFELLYRLPHDGWPAGPDAPLQDAQRAMRVIRAGAGRRWAIDPARVAVAGFSAGGHLAARLAARAAVATYQPLDAADRLSAAPLVAGLFFPVVTMMDDGVHQQSRRELLGAQAGDPAWQRRYSAQIDLPPTMPPTSVMCNMDDPVVPWRNSVLMAEALHAAAIPAELMVFERGGHGPPAPHRDGSPVRWIDLFVAWTRDHGWPV